MKNHLLPADRLSDHQAKRDEPVFHRPGYEHDRSLRGAGKKVAGVLKGGESLQNLEMLADFASRRVMESGPTPSLSLIQNNSGLSQGPAVHSAARYIINEPLQEDAMTRSDFPWVVLYSIALTLLTVSWVYVPA